MKKKILIITAIVVAVIAVVVSVFAITGAISNNSENKTSIVDKVDNKKETKKEKEDVDSKEESSKAEEKKADNKKNEDNKETAKKSDNSSTEVEQKKVTPTFMYFVSKKDADYDTAMSNVEHLKKKYTDKVNFDIIDVDENPDAKKNFPVDGQTPTLIMLNTTNDISALEFKCSDEEKLTKAIENALK